MNLCTRLGARSLPWAEIAAFRFLIGAAIAVGLATLRGTSLRVTDRPGTWRRSIFGTLSAIGAFYALSSDRIAVGDGRPSRARCRWRASRRSAPSSTRSR